MFLWLTKVLPAFDLAVDDLLVARVLPALLTFGAGLQDFDFAISVTPF